MFTSTIYLILSQYFIIFFFSNYFHLVLNVTVISTDLTALPTSNETCLLDITKFTVRGDHNLTRKTRAYPRTVNSAVCWSIDPTGIDLTNTPLLHQNFRISAVVHCFCFSIVLILLFMCQRFNKFLEQETKFVIYSLDYFCIFVRLVLTPRNVD